jgi:hypothetical protein
MTNTYHEFSLITIFSELTNGVRVIRIQNHTQTYIAVPCCDTLKGG